MQADSLDEDKSGLVSMDEFCKLFEPTIVRRSSSAGTMDIDNLMKEVSILWACLDSFVFGMHIYSVHLFACQNFLNARCADLFGHSYRRKARKKRGDPGFCESFP